MNRTETDSDLENKLVVINGERDGRLASGREFRGTNYDVSNYKVVLYSTGKYSQHFIITIFIYLVFSEQHPWHMEVPRLGVESELQTPAYARSLTH